ncbi:tyrosine-type recombinase/integrase [Thermophilibacter sp.]
MFYTAAYLQQRKDCKGWRGFLDYKDGDGKRRKKSKTLKATGKVEAKRELAEWRAEMEEEHEKALGNSVSASNLTVSDYVDAMVDRMEDAKAIEASTVSGYRTSARYIREAFSSIKMGELEPDQIRRWEAELTKRGLSSSTVGKAHRLLKQAFKDAVNSREVSWNPVDAVKPPKRTKKHPGINALDKAGRTALLDKLGALDLSPVTVAARVALFTGLREAEICGLQWRDVDVDSGVLWVRRSIGSGKGGTYVKLAKTDRVRDVALPKSLIALLADWRAAQEKAYARMDAVIGSESYIIGDPLGYYRPGRLSKDWTALSRALGVLGTEGRIPTFHDLRHTWATMYIAAGGDVKTAASNLGHANPSMTLNIYASADPDAKRRAAVIVEENMRAEPDEILPFTGTDG